MLLCLWCDDPTGSEDKLCPGCRAVHDHPPFHCTVPGHTIPTLGPCCAECESIRLAEERRAAANAPLIEELKASRRRLVSAQDEERRRLERNLHDGAQQQLVALQVKQRLAEQLVDRDPAKAKEIVDTLRNWVGNEIGPIAKPDEIRFGDNLPKTRSGKIMRRLLRSIATGEEITQDVSTLENPAILEQLKESVR